MKIIAINSAVGQTTEDIISKGGLVNIPSSAQIHNIVSDSAQDDSNGICQEETATAAGTITGIAQVETAVIVGTIGAAGAGNAKVIVTSALFEEDLEISVAVANDDTASQVATKVRAALNLETDITDNFTVGGNGANVVLTAKAAAANDTTLNIAYDNDTCTGLTGDASSNNTTAGHPGTGNAQVVVTAANLTGSPVTYNVPVTIGDTAAQWAAKVRSYLGAQAALINLFDVGGTGTAIKLTAKQGLANDSTLNIALADGTSNGITTAASSANTTAGVAGTGAKSVVLKGINESYNEVEEVVYLQGVTPVATINKYRYINEFYVKSAGTGGKNAGLITATSDSDSAITSQIEVGNNKAQQAVYMVPKEKHASFSYINISSYNATEGAITTISIMVKEEGGVWIPEWSLPLTSSDPKFIDHDWISQSCPQLKPGSLVKISAVASAGSSEVKANFDIVYN